MDEEMKKRIQRAKAAGFTDQQIQQTMAAKQAADQQKQQQSGMSVDQAVQQPAQSQPQPEQQDGFLKGVVRSLVKPAVEYGKMVGGAGYETYRAIKQAAGDEHAYVDKDGKVIENPLLSQEDLKKFSPTEQGGYTKPMLEGAKRTAGAMSYAVPGGVGVKGAIKAGAAAGGAYGFSQSEADDLEGLTVDTAVGALAGGATTGALKGAGEVVKKAGGAGDAMRKNVMNPKATADPFMAEEEQKIFDTLQKAGLKGSAEAQKQQVPAVFRNISANIQKKLKSSKGSIATADATATIDQALDNNINFDIDNPAMLKAKEKYMNQLVKSVNKSDETSLVIKPAQLYEFKQNLGKQLSNVFKKLDKGTPLTEKEEVAHTFWASIDGMLTKAEPAVKDMTRAQSYLYKAMPGLAERASSKTQLPVIGQIPGVTRPAQATQDFLGRQAQNLAGLPDKVPTAAASATMRGAPLLAADAAMGQPPTQPAAADLPVEGAVGEDPAAGGELKVEFVSPDGQWQMKSDGNAYSMDDAWVYDKEANDWVENPNAGGKSNPDAPMSLADYNAQLSQLSQNNDTASVRQYGLLEKERNYYYPEEKDSKPLPVAAQNQVNLAKSGSRGLEHAIELYQKDPSVLTKQLVPGQWVSREFDSAMFKTVEALLRARSGAAVPEQEVRRYLTKYGATFGDDPQVVAFKFEQLRQDFKDVLEGAGNTAWESPTAAAGGGLPIENAVGY